MAKPVSFLGICALLGLAAGCSKQAEAPKALPTLTIGILSSVDPIPIIVAEQNGYFADEGVDVVIKGFTSAQERNSAFQAGALDAIQADILSAALFREAGFETLVASATDGDYKLLASGASGIQSVGGLRGKKVAVVFNTVIEYMTDSMLAKQGVQPGDVEKVAVPSIPTRLQMLQTGSLDAATLPEPLASEALRTGARLLSASKDLGIDPSILLFAKKYVDAHRDALRSFYRAYDKGVAFVNANPPSAYMDAVIKTAVFPESVKSSFAPREYRRAGLPSREEFDRVMRWLAGKGTVKGSYTYEDLVDGSGLPAAR